MIAPSRDCQRGTGGGDSAVMQCPIAAVQFQFADCGKIFETAGGAPRRQTLVGGARVDGEAITDELYGIESDRTGYRQVARGEVHLPEGEVDDGELTFLQGEFTIHSSEFQRVKGGTCNPAGDVHAPAASVDPSEPAGPSEIRAPEGEVQDLGARHRHTPATGAPALEPPPREFHHRIAKGTVHQHRPGDGEISLHLNIAHHQTGAAPFTIPRPTEIAQPHVRSGDVELPLEYGSIPDSANHQGPVQHDVIAMLTGTDSQGIARLGHRQRRRGRGEAARADGERDGAVPAPQGGGVGRDDASIARRQQAKVPGSVQSLPAITGVHQREALRPPCGQVAVGQRQVDRFAGTVPDRAAVAIPSGERAVAETVESLRV